MQNLVKKGVKGSCDLLLEFWDPLHISGMVEDRNFKFVMQIGPGGTYTKKCKIRSTGVVKGPRDLLLKFRDSSISPERLKLETSNLACRLATGGSKRNNAKLGQKGS